jgi:hypothetical protein
MKNLRGWRWVGVIGFSAALTAFTGCNTWMYSSGITGPSGRYLDHPAQYIPPTPDFPQGRELATMQQQQLTGPGAAAAPAPPPAAGGIAGP